MNYPEVISIGNMLVEVMRKSLDQPLDQAADFSGPYPSGDVVIYIDTVARLGRKAGFIGAIGADDFGKCLLDRFTRDQVDFSCGKVLTSHTTGVAFVAYFSDKSRKFIFHWRNAAAGQLSPDDIQPEYFRHARWLHLTGCNLAINDSTREACLCAMRALPISARLSFDANIRPEILTVAEIRELVQPVIERADVILPSANEAAMLTGAKNDEEGCRLWASQGKIVALKQGEKGCHIYESTGDYQIPGFRVDEVDPTGAGDAFCAGFTVALLEGMNLENAGRFANAVGALAVTKMGPMEGAPERAEVEQLIKNQIF